MTILYAYLGFKNKNKKLMKIAILGTAYPYRGGIAAFNERSQRAYC